MKERWFIALIKEGTPAGSEIANTIWCKEQLSRLPNASKLYKPLEDKSIEVFREICNALQI